MKISAVIKYVLSLGLAGVLFYYAFQKVALNEFLEKISEVNYWWVWASMIISLISHWFRAYRWNLMLRPLGYAHVSDNRTFLAVMTGYLANLAFPRLGEVTRCGVMKRNDQVPMSVSFGSVITERLIDFFILLSLIVLDFVIEFDKVFGFFVSSLKNGMVLLGIDPEVDYTWYIIGFALFSAVGLVVLIVLLKHLLTKEYEHPFLQKLHRVLQDVVNGLSSVKKVENMTGFVLSTIGIWVAYFLMSYVVFFALGETSSLGFGAGLSILAAAGVAMAIPVQGGIGTYHTLISGVLIIYGVEGTTSLFFATLLHTSQLIMIMAVGGACVLITAIIAKQRNGDSPIVAAE